MIQTDIAILGGGPGGYVAALRAAQLGAQVVLIEEKTIGGVCLNVGCIPTKALLRSAEVYRAFRQAETFGLRLEGVQQLVQGVEKLLHKAGVQVLRGRGRFIASRVLEATTAEGVQRVEAKHVVIATGSQPVRLPLPGMDLPGVIDSTGALALEALPERLLVIGGGAIGVEFADIFNALGAEVTVVEMLDRLLPQMDADLGPALVWTLGQRGVQFHLNSVAKHVTRTDAVESGLSATVVTPSGEVEIEADRVMIAVGRRPNVEDLGLKAAGVRFDKAGISVDPQMQTNVPGIAAVGDVTGGPLLAHVAMRGGEVAAENALGHTATLDLKTVPWCVYTDPEVASVGLTEAQAREAGYDVRVGRFPLNASGKALTYGETDGFVKVVSEARFGEVLGLHLVAPHASDLIHEGGLAFGHDRSRPSHTE